MVIPGRTYGTYGARGPKSPECHSALHETCYEWLWLSYVPARRSFWLDIPWSWWQNMHRLNSTRDYAPKTTLYQGFFHEMIWKGTTIASAIPMKIHDNINCQAALHSEFGVVLHQVHTMRLQGRKPQKFGAAPWEKTKAFIPGKENKQHEMEKHCCHGFKWSDIL